MGEAKIKKAFCKQTECTYSIEEVAEIKKESSSKFAQLKEQLVCYECKIPKMIPRLGENNEHGFAKQAHVQHASNCDYFGEPVKSEEANKLIKKIKDNDAVSIEFANTQLDLAFEVMNQAEKSLNKQSTFISSNTITTTKTRKRGDSQTHKKQAYLPRKKLTKRISDDDFDIEKMYYGECTVNYFSEPRPEQENYNYLITIKCNKKYKFSLLITKTVAHYLGNTITELKQACEDKSTIQFAVIGKLYSKDNYVNLKLWDSRLLRID